MSVRTRRRVGLGAKSVIAAIAVVGIAALILGQVNRVILERSAQTGDARKMRRIYVALTLYEEANDGMPPNDLRAVRRDLGDNDDYIAANDPFTTGSRFPTDPALLNSGASSVRVSFSYLPQWVLNQRWEPKNWASTLVDPKVGLLADYWFGSIDRFNPDGRDCTGPVVRMNTDGSIFTLQKRRSSGRLTAEDLFLNR